MLTVGYLANLQDLETELFWKTTVSCFTTPCKKRLLSILWRTTSTFEFYRKVQFAQFRCTYLKWVVHGSNIDFFLGSISFCHFHYYFSSTAWAFHLWTQYFWTSQFIACWRFGLFVRKTHRQSKVFFTNSTPTLKKSKIRRFISNMFGFSSRATFMHPRLKNATPTIFRLEVCHCNCS